MANLSILFSSLMFIFQNNWGSDSCRIKIAQGCPNKNVVTILVIPTTFGLDYRKFLEFTQVERTIVHFIKFTGVFISPKKLSSQ